MEAIPELTKRSPPNLLLTLHLVCIHQKPFKIYHVLFLCPLIGFSQTIHLKDFRENKHSVTETACHSQDLFSSFLLVTERLDLWLCPWPPT